MPLHVVDAYPKKSCQVTAVKSGTNVWIATGEFMGEHLSAKGRSEIGAVTEWKNLAEFRAQLKQRVGAIGRRGRAKGRGPSYAQNPHSGGPEHARARVLRFKGTT